MSLYVFVPPCAGIFCAFQCKRLRLRRARPVQRGVPTYTFRNSSCCDLLLAVPARPHRAAVRPSYVPSRSTSVDFASKRCQVFDRTRLLVYRGRTREAPPAIKHIPARHPLPAEREMDESRVCKKLKKSHKDSQRGTVRVELSFKISTGAGGQCACKFS